jgi:endonuclease/exonuclease/phosphatase family metal-dependent hydrolase
MKIATFNIDWARKYRSRNHFSAIEKFLSQQDFDFLILTEAIHLNLKNFNFKYFSETIPEGVVYENIDYTTYLRGEKAFRTVIYSKTPFKKRFKVKDDKTSLALEFETEFGNLVIYATIIGTWFNRKPFAENELQNCISDCRAIFKENQDIIIVGDLNTSFVVNEEKFTINEHTTNTLKGLFDELNLTNLTQGFSKNIDHIIIPMRLKDKNIRSEIFIEKGKYSDHAGIVVSLRL